MENACRQTEVSKAIEDSFTTIDEINATVENLRARLTNVLNKLPIVQEREEEKESKQSTGVDLADRIISISSNYKRINKELNQIIRQLEN